MLAQRSRRRPSIEPIIELNKIQCLGCVGFVCTVVTPSGDECRVFIHDDVKLDISAMKSQTAVTVYL